MATQVQLRRGTSTENDSFTGAQGELTYDTTNKRVRIHDGGTAGGFEIKTEDGSGNTIFADNEKAIFGAGSDLQIYHDGSASYIDDAGTGDLNIRSSNDLWLLSIDNEKLARFAHNGAVTLYYDNASKFATTSSGINVTGTAVTDGLTVAGNVSVDGGTIKLDGNYPTGTNNVAMGDQALDSVTTGSDNTAIGYASLTGLTDGDYNTALGDTTLAVNTGSSNTAIGREALKANTTADDNVAVGRFSMGTNTTGTRNVAVGSFSLDVNTTGDFNVAIGRSALGGNTTASNNTAVGYQALTANTTAINNVAVGYQSLYTNTTGTVNTGIGKEALANNTTGSGNVAVGSQAMLNNLTGGSNTAFGSEALKNATGNSNTGIGKEAGSQITSGEKNTIIGRYNGNQGGLDIRTSNNNIVLSDGDGNPRLVIDSSGRIGMGTTTTGTTGTYFVPTTNSRTQLYMGSSVTTNTALVAFQNPNGGVGTITTNGSATAYNTSSDYRLKENVTADWDATTRLKQLNPVRFNFIADADTTVDGFLAHEVQSVVPEAITGTHNEVDGDGNPVYQGIDQSKLVPLLVKTIQELEARITALEGA